MDVVILVARIWVWIVFAFALMIYVLGLWIIIHILVMTSWGGRRFYIPIHIGMLPKIIFIRGGNAFFGKFIWCIGVLKFILLIEEGGNLVLGALKEFIDLTLPLMLDWIIPPLHSRRTDRMETPSMITIFALLASNYHSGLWSRGPRTRCSYLPMVTLLQLLHVLALNILILDLLWVLLIIHEHKLVQLI